MAGEAAGPRATPPPPRDSIAPTPPVHGDRGGTLRVRNGTGVMKAVTAMMLHGGGRNRGGRDPNTAITTTTTAAAAAAAPGLAALPISRRAAEDCCCCHRSQRSAGTPSVDQTRVDRRAPGTRWGCACVRWWRCAWVPPLRLRARVPPPSLRTSQPTPPREHYAPHRRRGARDGGLHHGVHEPQRGGDGGPTRPAPLRPPGGAWPC